MIFKNKTYKRPKFDYLLRYMMEDKERLLDDHGQTFVVRHNVRGNNIDEWAKQFRANEQHRLRKRKNSVYVNHDIISFHRDSGQFLTPEKLERIVREYIRLRNPKGMYVACAHTDRDHVHIHICTSAIEYRTGKSMRMSRQEFATLKKNIQQFQIEQYPELSRSVVNHGRKSKGRVSEKEMQFKLRTGKMSQRELVQSTVAECYRKSKSTEDFYARLKEQKLETYVRGGRVYGVVFGNRNFRFKTLGIDLSADRSVELTRNKELRQLRKRDQTRGIERDR